MTPTKAVASKVQINPRRKMLSVFIIGFAACGKPRTCVWSVTVLTLKVPQSREYKDAAFFIIGNSPD
jgi:hypothetical protein